MGARKGKGGTHDDLELEVESPKWDATNVEQTTDAAPTHRRKSRGSLSFMVRLRHSHS